MGDEASSVRPREGVEELAIPQGQDDEMEELGGAELPGGEAPVRGGRPSKPDSGE